MDALRYQAVGNTADGGIGTDDSGSPFIRTTADRLIGAHGEDHTGGRGHSLDGAIDMGDSAGLERRSMTSGARAGASMSDIDRGWSSVEAPGPMENTNYWYPEPAFGGVLGRPRGGER